MYITLDTDHPAISWATFASALSAPATDPAMIILDGESVTIATTSGLAYAYGDDDETAIALIEQASGRPTAYGADAAMWIKADPAEAARWISIWLDPSLA